MILNALFWEHYFRAEFLPQIKALVDTLEKRVLPGFSEIEKEAEQVSEDAWEKFMEIPATGDEDPSDFADIAEQAGVSHYLLLSGIRQGMLNLFAAALHHAFEQQIMLFHRREVLRLHEENDTSLMNISLFCARLSEHRIDVANFQSWPTVEELRHVANVVKHAEGRSAKALHEVRPDMFNSPETKRFEFMTLRPPRVFQPLVGEDLYVTLEDIKVYKEATLEFWRELLGAMMIAQYDRDSGT